jgi:hypothetical protein
MAELKLASTKSHSAGVDYGLVLIVLLMLVGSAALFMLR